MRALHDAGLGPGARQQEGTGVPLNQLLAESVVGAVDAIKMDIEGAERSALDGARDRSIVLPEVCRAIAFINYFPSRCSNAARHSRANVCASAI
jgi:hypothetical protein